MSNPMRKSNEGFRPKLKNGKMVRVTIDVCLRDGVGEIETLRQAAYGLETLAKHGYMPANVQSVVREVLDAGEE